MAGFTVNGMNEMQRTMEDLARLTSEDKMNILQAGAKLLRDKMEQYVAEHHHRTGALEGSMSVTPAGDHIDVGPKGKVTRVNRRRRRQAHAGSGGTARGSKHHGARGYSTMEEIAWYLNYGTSRMDATHWFDRVMDEADEQVGAAEDAAWDEILKSKGV